jgi:hypothetical protein
MGSSKRSASGFDNSGAESSSRKKAKKESETSDVGDGDHDDDDDESQDPAVTQRKVKATRGSRSVFLTLPRIYRALYVLTITKYSERAWYAVVSR